MVLMPMSVVDNDVALSHKYAILFPRKNQYVRKASLGCGEGALRGGQVRVIREKKIVQPPGG
jgi:hypothetical protein